ncbi:hypothetical protein [Catellatospora sp. NPDC049609]|uniref:hypothetical protein n=1 Tax=Catellatospora sp. NPDC049609 TaxID=3155505 RepID=UPI00341F1B58
MGCLFVMYAAVFPRLGLIAIWVLRPGLVDAAFDTWIWPLLGLVFVPFATLLYVVLYHIGGLTWWEWFWVGVLAVFDIGQWGMTLRYRRKQAA